MAMASDTFIIDRLREVLHERKQAGRYPIVVWREELRALFSCEYHSLRPILLRMYKEKKIVAGRTLNSNYFTLPEYV